MTKSTTQSQIGGIPQDAWLGLPLTIKVMKNKESGKPCLSGGDWVTDVTTTCSGVPWIRSWNENGALMGKLVVAK